MRLRFAVLCWVGFALALFVSARPAFAADKFSAHESRHLVLGGYTADLALDSHWQVKFNREGDYLLLDYDVPGRPTYELAKLGVFHLVVPAAARSSDKAQLAEAFVVNDVVGVKKFFFGSAVDLRLRSRRYPEKINDGVAYSFVEPSEIHHDRSRSTKFVRAVLYFPPSFAADGGLFLVTGLQQSDWLEVSSEVIDLMKEIITSLRPQHAAVR